MAPARSQSPETHVTWTSPAVNTRLAWGQGQDRGTSVPTPEGEASVFQGRAGRRQRLGEGIWPRSPKMRL